MKIVGILLAAGSGTRFGGGKLLHRLPDGTPIGIASLRNLRAAVPEVLAIVRSSDDALRTLMESEGVCVRVCSDAHLGMARSFICGISSSRDAAGWVIALGDMPFVLPRTIKAVAAQVAKSGRIAIPAYSGKHGHPVGLGRRYIEELLKLEGDEGARSVVRRHAHEVDIVECDDPGILSDIDTAADLRKPAV